MCDIMSASPDQNGSITSTPEPRRFVTDCATGLREREDRGPLDQERPDEETRCRNVAPSPKLSLFDLCRSFRRHSKSGSVLCLASYVSKDTRSIQPL